MSGLTGPSAYFPDRTPTWTEVILSVLVFLSLVPDFLSPSAISWPAVIVGFLAFAVALGPGANSAPGKRIGRWFRGIGGTSRATVIILFAIFVGVMFRSDTIPGTLIADAGSGGLLAVSLYMVAYVVLAGEVSGWSADRERIDR